MLLIVSELWFIFFEDPTNLEVPSLNLRLSHLSPQKDIARTVDNDVLLVELTVFWCLYLIFWLRNKTMQKRRSPLVYEIFHPSKPYLHHPSCFIGAHFTGNLHPRIQQWPRGPLLGGSSQLIPMKISCCPLKDRVVGPPVKWPNSMACFPGGDPITTEFKAKAQQAKARVQPRWLLP